MVCGKYTWTVNCQRTKKNGDVHIVSYSTHLWTFAETLYPTAFAFKRLLNLCLGSWSRAVVKAEWKFQGVGPIDWCTVDIFNTVGGQLGGKRGSSQGETSRYLAGGRNIGKITALCARMFHGVSYVPRFRAAAVSECPPFWRGVYPLGGSSRERKGYTVNLTEQRNTTRREISVSSSPQARNSKLRRSICRS